MGPSSSHGLGHLSPRRWEALDRRGSRPDRSTEDMVKKGEWNVTHGHARVGQRSTEYRSWISMTARCSAAASGSPAAKYYGDMGVTVHPDWRGHGGFVRFLAHIGPAPTELHEVERIKNERGYEPGNVRWATRKEQMRHTRASRMITIDGETMCLAAWAERSGVPYKAVHLRITRRKWPDREAIFTPLLPAGAKR